MINVDNYYYRLQWDSRAKSARRKIIFRAGKWVNWHPFVGSVTAAKHHARFLRGFYLYDVVNVEDSGLVVGVIRG